MLRKSFAVIFGLILVNLVVLCSADEFDDNTVLYMKFDEGEGKFAEDSSAVGNKGIIHDCDWVDDAISEKALHFDGEKSYVEIPHNDALGGMDELTIGFWFKARKIGANPESIHNLVTKYDSYILCLDYASTQGPWARLYAAGGRVDFGQAMSLEEGRWYHFAFIYDGEAAKIYIDGELLTSVNTSGAVGSSSSEMLAIGMNEKYQSQYFDGIIDEVRVLNKALTEGELKQLMTLVHVVEPLGKLATTWGQ